MITAAAAATNRTSTDPRTIAATLATRFHGLAVARACATRYGTRHGGPSSTLVSLCQAVAYADSTIHTGPGGARHVSSFAARLVRHGWRANCPGSLHPLAGDGPLAVRIRDNPRAEGRAHAPLARRPCGDMGAVEPRRKSRLHHALRRCRRRHRHQ